MPRKKPTPTQRLSIKEARAANYFLGEPDQEILLTLHAIRFISTQQVMTLRNISRPRAQQQLIHLYRHRYLNRQPWDSQRHVYTLDNLGQEFVANAKGIVLEKRRQRPVSPFFLDHHLAVGNVYIALTVAARQNNLTFTWLNEIDAADQYDVPAGPRKLNPDAAFTLTDPAKNIRPIFVFLEIDRATESTEKWTQKISDYNDYFLSGRFASRWSSKIRATMLVTVPHLARLETLRLLTAQQWKAEIPTGPVVIGLTVHEAITPDRVLGLPWTDLKGSFFRLAEEKKGSTS